MDIPGRAAEAYEAPATEYEAPAIERVGTIAELTGGSNYMFNSDAVFGCNIPLGGASAESRP